MDEDSNTRKEFDSLESLCGIFQQLKHALNHRQSEQAIHHASVAISQLFDKQILPLLDIRAHTLATKGRVQAALADAQLMIDYAPEVAAGYLRKAEIFSMYGRQNCAIEAYDQGLSNVAFDYNELKRLSDGRNKAIDASKKTVDFFARLSTEVTSNIISRLSQATITACLMTSKTWQQRIFGSSGDAWQYISIDEDHDSHLINAAPFVGRFVEHLVINTPDKHLRNLCFQGMKNDYFSKIHSLKVSGAASNNLRPSLVTISNAIWQARATLTHIDIDLSDNKQQISLADVLLASNTLTNVIFSTKSSLTASTGDYSMIDNHHALTSLQLVSDVIKTRHIEKLLRRCGRLRRLVMCGCDPTVLEPIEKYALKLEILGYNCTTLVPESTQDNPQPGLKVLYTNDSGVEVPLETIFPLIYKNMKSLHDIQVLTSSPTEVVLQQLYATYPNVALEKMNRLIIWPRIRVQPLLMRAIRGVSTLKHLHIVDPHETNLFRVVLRLPPLTTLELSHVQTRTARATLIQLFDGYALLSATQSSLRTVIFRHCDEVDDSVLAALANIKTLEDVTIRGLSDVTTGGINAFLAKRRDHLRSLVLAEMDSVSDTSLITLSGSRCLNSIILEELPNLTDQAIYKLIGAANCTLTSVEVNHCALVSTSWIKDAKLNADTVVYNNEVQ